MSQNLDSPKAPSISSRLTRELQPLSAIEVETINGEAAGTSPYCDKLGQIFRLTRVPRSVKLWKRYR